MMVSRYGSHANVVGYEVFNEPMVGNLGENHASTQAVISWEAPIVNMIRLKDPERAVFFMLRGGGDNGLVNADFTKFGPMTNLVLDLHDYYNGLYGSGYTPDQESWVPSWDATHNQNFLDYHGTEDALVQNLAVCGQQARRRARHPARRRRVGRTDGRLGRARLPAPPALGHEPLRALVGAVEPGTGRRSVHAAHAARSRSTPWGPTSPSRSRRRRRRWGSPRPPTSRRR